MPPSGNDSILVKLTEIAGKQDVTNERLNTVVGEVAGLRARVHEFGNELTKANIRIGTIETERALMVPDFHDTKAKVDALEIWRTDMEGHGKGLRVTAAAIKWIIGLVLGSSGLAALVEVLK